jgi:hypothetical protein
MKEREMNAKSSQDGYLSWRDPESGEWMTLTPKGSPFENGARIEARKAASFEGVGHPVKTCNRSTIRYRNWSVPFRASGAVA